MVIKDDVRDMTEIKSRIAAIEARQNTPFDKDAWEKRKR
jgi:hypothetical protein